MRITNKERSDLINDIIKILKVQADRKRDILHRKSVIINPQLLINSNPTTYGPYFFETKFGKNPFITFGQVRLNQTRIKGALIVQAYVDSWVTSSGGINGFNLGVYALTPVPAGLTQHTITWIAVGKASLYKADNIYDNWGSAYNYRKAEHLYADDGSLEKPG